MTLKEMKEMARKSFEQKNDSKGSMDYIEVVGNKGVTHVKPSELPKSQKQEESEDVGI